MTVTEQLNKTRRGGISPPDTKIIWFKYFKIGKEQLFYERRYKESYNERDQKYRCSLGRA